MIRPMKNALSPRPSRFCRASDVLFAVVVWLVLAFVSVSTFAADAPEPDPAKTDSPLVETRTAAELPEKRKIPTSREVELRPDESDRQIRTRLTRIAKSQEVFKGIQIAVREGIVDLSGKVEEASISKSFSALAERVEGVIGVIDRIEVTDVKKTGLRLAQAEFSDLVKKFFRSIPYILSSFVILLLTLGLGYACLRFWRAVFRRRMGKSPLLAETAARLLAAPVYLLGFYLILRVGGLGTLATTVLGGTGMLGIILGLAGRNILENYLAGFMLSLRNPFKVGDSVKIGADAGTVYSVNSRCTMLLDGAGVLVQIPNSTVLASVIRNFTAHTTNQVVLRVALEPCSDVADFRAAYEEAIEKSTVAIAENPKASAVVANLEDGVLLMECSFWIDGAKHNVGLVKSNVLQALVLGLEDRKVELARSGKYPKFEMQAMPAPETRRGDVFEKKEMGRQNSEKKRHGLDAAVSGEATTPSEHEIIVAKAKDVIPPEGPGLRRDLDARTADVTSERSREAPPRSPGTSSSG